MSSPASRASQLQGRAIRGAASARLIFGGRTFLNFYGSGYLALGNVPEIRDAVRACLDEGAPFARQVPRTMGGRDPNFDSLEADVAAHFGAEASSYFSSGSLIGQAAMSALQGSFDLILLDELAHYNLRDAARLFDLPTLTFAHADAEHVERLLREHLRPSRRPLLVTDGVYPTTGRVPPLSDYAALVRPLDGGLLVDESHAFGVVGPSGRGAAAHCGVENVTLAGATFSKALCAHGAFIRASQPQIDHAESSSCLRGATAGSPLSAAAAQACLRYLQRHPDLQDDLAHTAVYLRAELRALGISVPDTPAPIVSFTIGDVHCMQALQRALFDEEILIYHSQYIGAGPEGVIRCAIFGDHTIDDIDRLISALKAQV